MKWVVWYHDSGSPCRRIGGSGHGGKTCKAGKGEPVRRLRADERALRVRLRSIKLVHDVYLCERPIDPGAVLALLPAERPMPRPALLRNRTRSARRQCPLVA
jgi:hypothetical protein